MKSKKFIISLMLLAIFAKFNVQAQEQKPFVFTADGPYITYKADGSMQVLSVTEAGEIQQQAYPSVPDGFSMQVTSSNGKYKFTLPLHDIERPAWKIPQAQKLFITSDPHSNIDCFVDLLQKNGIIDKNYNWIFGKNQMVVIGDIADRGTDATQIYWLMYKLEKEAADAGGAAIFTLGNHETMILRNDVRYTDEKYKKLADTLHVTIPELLSLETELGRWLSTRNTIQCIGRNLIVHAGYGADLYKRRLSIPWINEEVSRGLYLAKDTRKKFSESVDFMQASYGPVWYRGLVQDKPKYRPITSDTLNLILQHHEADRIIVGHTIFEEISTFYEGRVVAVNVDNAANREAGRSRAILIEGKKITILK